jgi:uncharacterized protein (TIGR00251 family)
VTGPLRQQGRAVVLAVRATPKASRNEITGLQADARGLMSLCVKVTAPPDKGKANAAIIETMARAMGVAKSTFRQISGETDRNKLFEISAHLDEVAVFVAGLAAKGKEQHGEDH